MKKTRILALALCLVMVFTSLAACSSKPAAGTTAAPTTQGSGETAAPGEATGALKDTISACVGPEPDSIDPALNSAVDGATVIIHNFEGLYTLDEDGVPVPGQAESVDISEDGLTYTFHLREGLKWSDGTPLTANDFVYSWKRAVDPVTAADYAYMFESIEGYAETQGEYDDDGNVITEPNVDALAVTAVDDSTLEVKLIAMTPYFLELTAFPTFSPVKQDVVEANGEAWATDASTYIGNGPYVMVEWVHSSHMLMKKNENYWNYDALGTENIKFQLIEDDATQLSAYEAGELDMIDAVPTDEIDALSAQSDFYKAGQLGTYYVSYQTQKKPMDNPLVRQALTLAVDRDYICREIGKAGQVPAGAFVPIGLTDVDPTKEFRELGGDYYDPTAAANEANLEKAKELLAEAGYPNGEGFPTIEYLYNEGTGHQLVGEALQSMWKELGINVELVSQEWATFLNTRKDGDYFVARNGWLGDYNDPISFLDMWITKGGNNDAQWSNAEYDELIKQIKSSADPAERMSLMHQAEDIIFDEWMLCPLYYYVDIYMISDNVEGFYASPLGYKYFMYATVAE